MKILGMKEVVVLHVHCKVREYAIRTHVRVLPIHKRMIPRAENKETVDDNKLVLAIV